MRIAVTCGLTSQGFLDPVEKLLRSAGHEVQRFNGVSANDIIPRVLKWGADAVWHEWADSIARDLSLVCPKPLVVRVHRYEVETEVFRKIRWRGGPGSIGALPVVTSQHVMNVAMERGCAGPVLVPSIVDFDKFTIPERPYMESLRMAVVGYLCGRKQPGLALAAASYLSREWNVELSFYGEPTKGEPYWSAYLDSIEGDRYARSVFPWTQDVPAIWNVNDVCLSTSAAEGCPYNVIEAMACGVTPFIHHYPGARDQFPSSLLWRTMRDLHEIATRECCPDPRWSREALREWAFLRYSIEANTTRVLELF